MQARRPHVIAVGQVLASLAPMLDAGDARGD
jgi:hypothetical protein